MRWTGPATGHEARDAGSPMWSASLPLDWFRHLGGRELASMSTDDKFDAKADELKGKVKETVGDATDDRDLEAEGKGDQAKGNLKQAAEKVKDAFKS
ncbi:hypothetical protein GCM10009634_76340 [Saccharothrix xinjiangensis]